MKIVYYTCLVLMFSFLANCRMLQSYEDKHDYYNDSFVCDSINPDPTREYGKYLESHLAQRLYIHDLNKSVSNSNIVLTGDSISALYRPELLKQDMPELEILNTGVGGDTTDLFLARLKDDVLKYKPSIVALSIGGNDLLRKRCVDDILNNHLKIIQTIHANNKNTIIILLSVPPVYRKRLNAIVLYYNLLLQYNIRGMQNVYYADLWDKLASQSYPGLASDYYIRSDNGKVDDVHFNPKGYKQLATILKKIIANYQR